MKIDIYFPLILMFIATFLNKDLRNISTKTIILLTVLSFLTNLSRFPSINNIKTGIPIPDGLVLYIYSSAVTLFITIIFLFIIRFIRKGNNHE